MSRRSQNLDASNEDAKQKKSDNEFDNVRVIPPKMPREFIHVVARGM